MEAQKRTLNETQHLNSAPHLPNYDPAFTFSSLDSLSAASSSTTSPALAPPWPEMHPPPIVENGGPHYEHHVPTSAMHPTSMANGVHAAQASSSHGRPELYQRGSNESSSLSDFSSHTFAGRHSESNTSLSTFSPPMAPGPSSRPMGTEERPLKQAAYDYFGSADNRISKASLSAWDALADGASHPRSNSVSSLLRSQNSAGTSPTEVNRHGASPSHSQGSGSLPAGASPQSDGSVNYFNAATKLSSAEADNCDTRYHDQSMLINRLKPYYSEKDRPFVALAISQFEALDSFEKMIPSRYLFGSSPGSSGRDPPAHVLLALLAFLAHPRAAPPGQHEHRGPRPAGGRPGAALRQQLRQARGRRPQADALVCPTQLDARQRPHAPKDPQRRRRSAPHHHRHAPRDGCRRGWPEQQGPRPAQDVALPPRLLLAIAPARRQARFGKLEHALGRSRARDHRDGDDARLANGAHRLGDVRRSRDAAACGGVRALAHRGAAHVPSLHLDPGLLLPVSRTHHGQDGQVAAHRFDAHAQGRGALQFRDDRRRQHGARVRERGRRSGGTRLPGAPAVAAAAVYASSDEGVDGGAVGDGWRGQAAAGSASGARRGARTRGGPVGECAAGGRGR
ncbi:hypothetical protein L1887_59631 [Cichorium endivia]|nr:hypothetical protein L1887_59631 [Cichorium endivia]